MYKFADIHCHIIPYVDDGAYTMQEAVALLRLEYEQGTGVVCLTPHLRAGMFESSDEKVTEEYVKLRDLIEKENLPLTLYQSREYHFDKLFRTKLEQGSVRPLGNSKNLLVEFGGRHTGEAMIAAIQLVKSAGYEPVIAHVERYAPVQQDLSFAQVLVDNGAKLQINAGSVLGREGIRQKHLVAKLMKQDLVCAIGSDAHDCNVRTPDLGKCAEYLEKKMSREYADRLLRTGPLDILQHKDFPSEQRN